MAKTDEIRAVVPTAAKRTTPICTVEKTLAKSTLMDTSAAHLDLLMEIESKHEELISQLDELDKRIQKTLAECQVGRGASHSQD